MKTTQIKNEFCSVAKKCSGCQLCNLTYEEQLKYKQAKCNRLLSSFCKPMMIHPMENPTRYRNKLQRAFAMTAGGLSIGIFQSSTGHIVATEDCLTENKKANEICSAIVKLAKSYKLKAYNFETGSGFLRHILIRTADGTGEIMVVIVTADKAFQKQNQFVNALTGQFPEIKTVVKNISVTQMPLVLGEKQEVLYGKGYIEDDLCGKKFRISPRSFYQINRQQAEYLYAQAVNFADIHNNETVFDAYCGTGTIGIIAAEKAKKVIGAEINEQAICDAEFNAQINKTENISFVCSDVIEVIKALKNQADIIIMDPPRQGSTKEFADAVINAKPQKIIYVSCNPETLRRDLYRFVKGGYKVKKIQPVDMFPYTKHVESVVLMTRVQK